MKYQLNIILYKDVNNSFIHSFFICHIYKILQCEVGIMRLKKKKMARRPERNHEACNESGLLNLG